MLAGTVTWMGSLQMRRNCEGSLELRGSLVLRGSLELRRVFGIIATGGNWIYCRISEVYNAHSSLQFLRELHISDTTDSVSRTVNISPLPRSELRVILG